MQRIFNLFDQYPVIPIGLLAFVVLLCFLNRRQRCPAEQRISVERPAAKGSPSGFLDRQILDLGGIPFTGKMATEGIFTCGELGWGKTFLVF